MADITVKKADGTTNIVYTAIKASAGDRDTAIWRAESGATFAQGKPELVCVAKPAANNTQRVTMWKLVMPETYTDTTTGLVAVRYRDLASSTFTIDLRVPDSMHNELAAQFGNLMASPAAVAINKGGFNAT